jgi:hypothetical protein
MSFDVNEEREILGLTSDTTKNNLKNQPEHLFDVEEERKALNLEPVEEVEKPKTFIDYAKDIGGKIVSGIESLGDDESEKSSIPNTFKTSNLDYLAGDKESAITKTLSGITESGVEGAKQSVTGMSIFGEPEEYVPSNEVENAVFGVTNVLSDSLIYLAGYLLGGSNPVSGTAGAFGLHSGIRKVLMDRFEHGQIDSFGEFFTRLLGASVETAKGQIVGAMSSKVGSSVPLAAKLPAQVAVFETVGSGLEGRYPTMEGTVDTSILLATLGILHAKSRDFKKVEEKYNKTKEEVIEEILDGTLEPKALKDLTEASNRNNFYRNTSLEAVKKDAELGIQMAKDELAHREIKAKLEKELDKKGEVIKSEELTKDKKYLSRAESLKALLGDKIYYKVLKAENLEHANQVRDKRSKKIILDKLREKIEEIKSSKKIEVKEVDKKVDKEINKEISTEKLEVEEVLDKEPRILSKEEIAESQKKLNAKPQFKSKELEVKVESKEVKESETDDIGILLDNIKKKQELEKLNKEIPPSINKTIEKQKQKIKTEEEQIKKKAIKSLSKEEEIKKPKEINKTKNIKVEEGVEKTTGEALKEKIQKARQRRIDEEKKINEEKIKEAKLKVEKLKESKRRKDEKGDIPLKPDKIIENQKAEIKKLEAKYDRKRKKKDSDLMNISNDDIQANRLMEIVESKSYGEKIPKESKDKIRARKELEEFLDEGRLKSEEFESRGEAEGRVRELVFDSMGGQQMYEKAVKAIKKSPSLKSIQRISRGIILEGKVKYSEFRKRMKEITGDSWELIKKYVRDAWKQAKDWNKKIGNRGSFSREVVDKIFPEKIKLDKELRDKLIYRGKQKIKVGNKEETHLTFIDKKTDNSFYVKVSRDINKDVNKRLSEISEAFKNQRAEQKEMVKYKAKISKNLIDYGKDVGYRFQVGDIVYHEKSGKKYIVRGLGWNTVKESPAYFMDEAWGKGERGTLPVEIVDRAFELTSKNRTEVRNKSEEISLEFLGTSKIYNTILERLSRKYRKGNRQTKKAIRKRSKEIGAATKLDLKDIDELRRARGLEESDIKRMVRNQFGWRAKIKDLNREEADLIKLKLINYKFREPLANEKVVYENSKISDSTKKKFKRIVKTYDIGDVELGDYLRMYAKDGKSLTEVKVKKVIELTRLVNDLRPYGSKVMFDKLVLPKRLFGEPFMAHWRDAMVKKLETEAPYITRVLNPTRGMRKESLDAITKYLEGKLIKDKLSPDEVKAANEIRKVYNELWKEFEIDEFIEEYSPRVPKFQEKQNLIDWAFSNDGIRNFKFWAEHKRTGELLERETNAKDLAIRYIRTGFAKKYYGEATKNIKPIMKKMSVDRRKMANTWIDSAIRKIPTKSEKAANEIIRSVLKKCHFKVDENSRLFKDLVGQTLDLNYSAFMGWRPKLGLRNLTQQWLIFNEYGFSYFNGRVGKFRPDVKAAMEKSPTYKSRKKDYLVMEDRLGEVKDIPAEVRQKMMHLYRLADLDNVETAFATGYLKAKKDHPNITEHRAIRAGEKAIHNTQWGYGIDLPYMFSTTMGKIPGQYMSWPIWYADHIHRIAREKHGAKAARTLLQAAIIGMVANKTSFDYTRTVLFGTVPTSLGFAAEEVIGFLKLVNTLSSWDKKEISKASIDFAEDTVLGLTPGYLAAKDLKKLMDTGDFIGYLTYTREKNKKKPLKTL